ncbi:MAG: LamG domain-containing protein [Candidatus Nanohaloarchaea archaeon]
MKGQINIEFLAGALLFVAAAGTLLISGTDVLPGLSQDVQETKLYSEAYVLTTQVLSDPGTGESFGLSTSADNYLVLDPEKISRLSEFDPSGNPDPEITYSEFKDSTGASNQYSFTFMWMPVVDTNGTIKRFRSSSIDRSNSDSLVGYWTMDETDGTATDNVIDESGDGNTGTATDGVNYNVAGRRGTSAFYFPREEHFSVGNGFASSRATISFWMKNRTAGGGSLAGFSNASGGGLVIEKSSDLVKFSMPNGGSGKEIVSGELSRGWNFVSANISSGGRYHLMVNGKTVDSGSGKTLNSLNTQELFVGASDADLTNSEGFDGKIDSFRIYNTALSLSEQQNIYSGEDDYTKEPVNKIIEPDGSSYKNSANSVRYGRKKLEGAFFHFLVTSHSGTYDRIYVSRTWNFAGKPPLAEGESFTVEGESFSLESVSNAGNSDGRSLVLKRETEQFGPEPSNSETVVRLERFAAYKNEPMKVEVLVW